MAALVVFFLGAINYYGYRTPAVALGVGITVLLYFKAEIEGFSHKLTATDVRSMLQFAVLTAVILPLLPDRAFGPYGVLNPFQIWLMVVLVAAVSLSGYVAWRLTLGRHGLLLTGVLGGRGLEHGDDARLRAPGARRARQTPPARRARDPACERDEAGARALPGRSRCAGRAAARARASLCRRCWPRWPAWHGAGSPSTRVAASGDECVPQPDAAGHRARFRRVLRAGPAVQRVGERRRSAPAACWRWPRLRALTDVDAITLSSMQMLNQRRADAHEVR